MSAISAQHIGGYVSFIDGSKLRLIGKVKGELWFHFLNPLHAKPIARIATSAKNGPKIIRPSNDESVAI